MEKSAQPGEAGGCTPTHFILSTITYKVVVYAPADTADTLPLFLYPYMNSVRWDIWIPLHVELSRYLYAWSYLDASAWSYLDTSVRGAIWVPLCVELSGCLCAWSYIWIPLCVELYLDTSVRGAIWIPLCFELSGCLCAWSYLDTSVRGAIWVPLCLELSGYLCAWSYIWIPLCVELSGCLVRCMYFLYLRHAAFQGLSEFTVVRFLFSVQSEYLHRTAQNWICCWCVLHTVHLYNVQWIVSTIGTVLAEHLWLDLCQRYSSWIA